MRRTPYCHERHGCSQLLGFVRPKWQRRGGAASGSFGDDARNLLRLRLVSPKLWRDHSYLSLGFVRPQRHLVLAERVVLAERALGSFGQHRMHRVAPACRAAVAGTARVRSAKVSHAWPDRLGFVRRNSAVTGTPSARLAKIFQIAPLCLPKKAG